MAPKVGKNTINKPKIMFKLETEEETTTPEEKAPEEEEKEESEV